ncbi:MAG: hypothetical protein AAF236_16465, partial [Verrucomicrobiota bacterium]
MSSPLSFRRAIGSLCAVASIVIAATTSPAQDDALHTFTSKNGQQIVAEVISISADKINVTIRRNDGQQFTFPILTLSLDDQDYLRSWLESQKDAVEYRLEVKAARVTGDDSKLPYGSYTFDTTQTSYNLEVQNLTREPLTGAKVEGIVIWENVIDPYLASDGDATYTYRSLESYPDQRVYATFTQELPELAFNLLPAGTRAREYHLPRVLSDAFHVLCCRVPFTMPVTMRSNQNLHQQHSASASRNPPPPPGHPHLSGQTTPELQNPANQFPSLQNPPGEEESESRPRLTPNPKTLQEAAAGVESGR